MRTLTEERLSRYINDFLTYSNYFSINNMQAWVDVKKGQLEEVDRMEEGG